VEGRSSTAKGVLDYKLINFNLSTVTLQLNCCALGDRLVTLEYILVIKTVVCLFVGLFVCWLPLDDDDDDG